MFLNGSITDASDVYLSFKCSFWNSTLGLNYSLWQPDWLLLSSPHRTEGAQRRNRNMKGWWPSKMVSKTMRPVWCCHGGQMAHSCKRFHCHSLLNKVKRDNNSFSSSQMKTNPLWPVHALSKQIHGVCWNIPVANQLMTSPTLPCTPINLKIT